MNFLDTVEPFAAMGQSVQHRTPPPDSIVERRRRGRRQSDWLPAGSLWVDRRKGGRRMEDQLSGRRQIVDRRKGGRRLQDMLVARKPITLPPPPLRAEASALTPLVVVICSFALLIGVAALATHPGLWQQIKPVPVVAEPVEAAAQYDLGKAYMLGRGVPISYAEAARWYRLAAEQGFAAAQYELGTAYNIGRGVTQDHVEAAKWYRKAAEQGLAAAQYNLGVAYMAGQGVRQDYAEAYTWLTLAVAKNLDKKWMATREAIMNHMPPIQITEDMQRVAAFAVAKTAGGKL